jgi:hypothetical protein
MISSLRHSLVVYSYACMVLQGTVCIGPHWPWPCGSLSDWVGWTCGGVGPRVVALNDKPIEPLVGSPAW